MTKITYNRPYQYIEDLRLFGCYRSKEHAVFVGQGFADNAIAFVENNGMLTQLESSGKVQHGDYDQLVTQRFDVDMPFRVYIVNPDDENGKASNAIEFTPSKDIPIVDVLVNGESVVKDQKAYVDISKKLDSIMKPNMLYGTDSDGKETQYSRQQVEGVQHFFLNGDEIPLDLGNIRITDIARESKSVQRVSEPLQLYGTNEQGAQATYPKDFFATSESVINAAKDIQNLKDNKQDKDTTAKDGYIAIMKNGQSVGSNSSFEEILKKINDTANEITDLTETVKKTSIKDWKSNDKYSRIENNPIGDSSIIISDKSIDDEKPLRETNSAVVYGLKPQSVGQYGTMVGSMNQVAQYGTAVGSYSSANGDSSTAIGTQSNADGDHASSFGVFSSAKKRNSLAIGKGAEASAENATAIGADSQADVENTVSIGFETSDPKLKPQYRRLMAVDEPVSDHDAANKKYVDSKIGTSSSGSPNKVISTDSPIINKLFNLNLGNIDGWKETNTNNTVDTNSDWTDVKFIKGTDAPSTISFPTYIDNPCAMLVSKRFCKSNVFYPIRNEMYTYEFLISVDQAVVDANELIQISVRGENDDFKLKEGNVLKGFKAKDYDFSQGFISFRGIYFYNKYNDNSKGVALTIKRSIIDSNGVETENISNGNVYVNKFNFERIVKDIPYSISFLLPYFNSYPATLTPVGGLLYFNFRGFSRTPVSEKIPTPVDGRIPLEYAPFNDIIVPFYGEDSSSFYLIFTRQSYMEFFGTINANVTYRGNTVYPMTDSRYRPTQIEL